MAAIACVCVCAAFLLHGSLRRKDSFACGGDGRKKIADFFAQFLSVRTVRASDEGSRRDMEKDKRISVSCISAARLYPRCCYTSVQEHFLQGPSFLPSLRSFHWMREEIDEGKKCLAHEREGVQFSTCISVCGHLAPGLCSVLGKRRPRSSDRPRSSSPVDREKNDSSFPPLAYI